MSRTIRDIIFQKYTLLILAVVLISLSFVFNRIYTSHSTLNRELRNAESFIATQEKDFESFCNNGTQLKKLAEQHESLPEFETIAKRPYGIFLYRTENETGIPQLTFWSDQLILPPPSLQTLGDGEYFFHLANGYYVAVKKTLDVLSTRQPVFAYAMIPVRSDFFIETEYLRHDFYFSKTAAKTVALSDEAHGTAVKGFTGKTLFYLANRDAGTIPYNDTLTIILRGLGLLCLLFFLHLWAEEVVARGKVWTAIGLLAISLLALRISVYLFPAILNLRQFELFNPAIYGSNIIQRSLGDLLINAILFCWVILFAWSHLHQVKDPGAKFSKRLKWLSGLLSMVLLLVSTFILSSVIRSLVADSKISFDVINFDSVNRYTVAGFAVLTCLSLSYYYFTQLLFRLIFPLFGSRNELIYFVIASTGLVYLTIRSGDPTVLFYIPVLVWLLGYTWLVNRKGLIFNRIRVNIAGIIFWIFVFSVSIAAIILSENKKAEWERRKILADKLVVQNDPSSERLLNIALSYLDNDFLLTNLPRFRGPDEGKLLRDSIINSNYGGYLNKYDTKLYLYEADGRPVQNDDATSYDDLNTILTVQSKPTRLPDLYSYESAVDKFKYITKRVITDTAGATAGSLFIISIPKNYRSDALFPELFKQFNENDPSNSPIYATAVYDKKRLTSSSNKYPFATSLTSDQEPSEEFERRSNGQYDEMWYRAGNDQVVVMVRKKDNLIESITLFSWIFCAFLFLVAFLQIISVLLRTGGSLRKLRKMLQLSIRSQVHSTILFISVFSFLIIGISTISFFISRYNRNNTDKLSRTMKIMVNEMQKKLSDHSTFDDVLKLYDSVTNKSLQNLVNEISDIHGVDVNVYDLQGNLYVSSQANVYNRGVLSKKIDPTAFYHLSRLRQVQHSQEERIGSLSYLSMYAPVRDENKNVYAYLNIPYFTAQPELNQEISNFLVTIINLNAFIFLIAGLIALYITNRITDSFSLISDKMKEVNLGKMNEMIVWNREDEIGELVKEYNTMVGKLGESAKALAKSEREGAWREMARQVAHEIKNPLTPMKLSIQYLQNAVNNNQPNVKELSGRVANTLVEQIDHLSKIAADFSQFANIGNTHTELFDLHDVIASLHELYRPNPEVTLQWEPVHRRVMVNADKTQMNRLFTNLLANAVEACQGQSTCQIEVKETVVDDKFRISIRDNGEGIAPEMQARIFIPNFTTKTSGTGLGLAMCKGIVEKAQGDIWFETTPGSGTTFVVELPLVG